jgi:hypothetical protein
MNGRALYPIFYHLLRVIRKTTYTKRCSLKSSTICKEQIIKRAKKKKPIHLAAKMYITSHGRNFIYFENKKCNY